MKAIISFLVISALFVSTVIHGQGWEDNVNTNISYSGDFTQYDMVGNEMGFHLAVCENNQVKYYLLGADGSTIKERSIGSSGLASPAITYQIYNGSKIHITCFDAGNQEIKIFQSTDDGDTWSSHDEIALYRIDTTYSATNLAIDAVGDDEYIHITFGDYKADVTGSSQSSSNEKVFYTYFDLEYEEWSVDPKEVTDHADASIGWNPTIVLSDKQGVDLIHVLFTTSINIDDPKLTVKKISPKKIAQKAIFHAVLNEYFFAFIVASSIMAIIAKIIIISPLINLCSA